MNQLLQLRLVSLIFVGVICSWYLIAKPKLASADIVKNQTKHYKVGISQIVEHPSLNTIRAGLEEILNTGDLKGLVKISYVNAQGSPVTSGQAARKLIGEEPDVVVGISTISAQGLLATKTKIPIVFSGVNDPLAAKLVKDLAHPEANVTGVMLVSPVKEQLQLILEILPQARRIAIIYSIGEVNAVKIAESFQEAGKSLACQTIPISVTSSSQVQAAAQSLVGRADAVYLPTDNTVISALGTILKIGAQEHLPIFAADTASVQEGALAALGLDHFVIGQETGQLVARLLKGTPISQLAVVAPQRNELHINQKFAKQMGVVFPPQVLKRANKVY